MNWLPTTIGDVCVPTSQVDPGRNGTSQFRYVDISGVDRETKTVLRTELLPTSAAPSRARKLIRTNDVLVSTVRPNLNAIAIVPDELDDEIASTGFAVLRADPKLVNPIYLFYWAQRQEFIDFLVANATGASYPAVTENVVKRAPLLLPPPSEQHRIIQLLDETNHLRRSRRDADTKAVRLLPALFIKMFGDPATNPMGWPTTTLGELIASADYGSSTKASDDGRGIPLIRMGNVDYAGNLDLHDLKFVVLEEIEASRYRLENGDILFNRTNSKELVGKTGLWDGRMDAVIASYFIRIRVNESRVRPCFIWALMNSAHMKSVLRATARGAIGQANINSVELRSLGVFEPPYELQLKFETYCASLQSFASSRAIAAESVERLFVQMLRRAFSGQLTAKWRNAHSKELLTELEQQAQILKLPLPQELESAA